MLSQVSLEERSRRRFDTEEEVMSISQGDGRHVATSLGRTAAPLKLEEARNVFSALSL